METSIELNGRTVYVTLRKNGSVQWCSDWAALSVAAASGHSELRVWDCGPYGHREIFVVVYEPVAAHKISPRAWNAADRATLIAEIEAADLESPEQVADMVLDAAARGGLEAGRAKLAACAATDTTKTARR